MQDRQRSDAEIIEASLTDPAEFETIFRRHHSAIYQYAIRRVGVANAGDLAADVFVRAFSIRRRYDLSRADCRPWLYGIAANLAGDRLRRLRIGIRVLFEASSPEPQVDRTADSDSRLVADDLADDLNAALGQLSDDDRTTFLLFALEKLTYSEIGEILDVPPGTVGSRISRVRSRIIQLIPDLEERIHPEGDKS